MRGSNYIIGLVVAVAVAVAVAAALHVQTPQLTMIDISTCFPSSNDASIFKPTYLKLENSHLKQDFRILKVKRWTQW